MFAQRGVSKAHAVPGAVDLGVERHRFAERLDGLGEVFLLFVNETEVEPEAGSLRIDL